MGIEITYSTPNAEEVVQALSKKFGNSIILGMGTLTKPEQAISAKAAGACFLVSPVCEPNLVKGMVDSGLLTMAGALNSYRSISSIQHGCGCYQDLPRFPGWTSLY